MMRVTLIVILLALCSWTAGLWVSSWQTSRSSTGYVVVAALILVGVVTIATLLYRRTPLQGRWLRALHKWWLPEAYMFPQRELGDVALFLMRLPNRHLVWLLCVCAFSLTLARIVLEKPGIEPADVGLTALLIVCVIAHVRRARRSMRDWLQKALIAADACPDCGYDLAGNVSGVCPGCGRVSARARIGNDDGSASQGNP